MVDGGIIELKPVYDDSLAEARMLEIEEWAKTLGIDDYIDVGYTCVRISKNENLLLFVLKFSHLIDYV